MGRFQNYTRSSAAEKASAFIDSLVEIGGNCLVLTLDMHCFLWKKTKENQRYICVILQTEADIEWYCVFLVFSTLKMHTCQPIQFTGIKINKKITSFWGGYGHNGRWIQENIIFMRFCCCFKMSKKIKKTVERAADTCQMHTDWTSATR